MQRGRVCGREEWLCRLWFDESREARQQISLNRDVTPMSESWDPKDKEDQICEKLNQTWDLIVFILCVFSFSYTSDLCPKWNTSIQVQVYRKISRKIIRSV